MRVACRHGVTNAKQLKASCRVGPQGLRLQGGQRRVVRRAQIAGVWLQCKVQIIEWQCAVVNNDLVDDALFAHATVVAAHHCPQTLVAALYRQQAKGHGKGHVQLL